METLTRQLADPQTLARIARLELRARAVVEGVISGMHKSPHRGSSVEFAQHRDYVPGDGIRHIDWKVYARSDRYHIKQFEEETNLKGMLVVDASTSMNYKGENSPLSKREYASIVAAAIGSRSNSPARWRGACHGIRFRRAPVRSARQYRRAHAGFARHAGEDLS